ncbi:MAG: hypothetical protein OXR68_06530 [Alphaproteobacteria bacterium]|nr:hypothetical protein [Alphaproteobacteria bacterium]
MKRTLLLGGLVLPLLAVSEAYADNGGNYCREYQKYVKIDGKREKAYGTACLQENGSWKLISEAKPKKHGKKQSKARKKNLEKKVVRHFPNKTVVKHVYRMPDGTKFVEIRHNPKRHKRGMKRHGWHHRWEYRM